MAIFYFVCYKITSIHDICYLLVVIQKVRQLLYKFHKNSNLENIVHVKVARKNYFLRIQGFIALYLFYYFRENIIFFRYVFFTNIEELKVKYG